MEDLDQLQWMVQNEASFRTVFALYKEKYSKLAETRKLDYPELATSMAAFFMYMSSVWVESKEFKWYEGANPWGPVHNQSIEGINNGIKENYTFRHKLEMGELFRYSIQFLLSFCFHCLLLKGYLQVCQGQEHAVR